MALITGAGRCQGRSHAVAMADAGADVVVTDIAAPIAGVGYSLADRADLEETARLVEKTGRRGVARVADVRDLAAMEAAVAAAIEELGGLDVVVANAGVVPMGPIAATSSEEFRRTLDINLTGAFHTIKAAIPALRTGGSIVVVGSVAAIKGPPGLSAYASSKAGLIGLVRTAAAELGPQGIRVNMVAPTTVNTEMIHREDAYRAFRPDLEHPGLDDVIGIWSAMNVLPTPWVEPSDVSAAVLWLASDDARYVTAAVIPVDAGALLR